MATTYYFLPTRNLFGEDSVQEAGTLMQSLGGKKALIVTDSFLASSGMAASIQEILTRQSTMAIFTWRLVSVMIQKRVISEAVPAVVLMAIIGHIGFVDLSTPS